MNFTMPVHLSGVADPFAKSPQNPMSMSRDADKPRRPSTAPVTKVLEKSRNTARELAELAVLPAAWKFVTEKQNTMVYELHGEGVPESSSIAETFGGVGGNASDFYVVKGVTTVYGDVDHVLQVLNTNTTEAFSQLMSRVFKDLFVNGVVIDQLSCTTPPPQAQDDQGNYKSFDDDDSYVVNWIALRPGNVLSTSDNTRDFTFVSYQDVFQRNTTTKELERKGCSAACEAEIDEVNAPLGVHAMTSLQFADIPQLPKSTFTDRLHFRHTGFVVEATTEPHVFRLSMFLSLVPNAMTLKHPKRFGKWLQSLAVCASNLALQVKPEVTMHLVPKNQWKKSDHCYLCLKIFRAFRRCHHCRFCGEAICHRCSGFVNLQGFELIQRDRYASSNTSDADGSGLSSRSRTVSASSNSDSEPKNGETRSCNTCIQDLMQNLALAQSRRSSYSSKSSISGGMPPLSSSRSNDADMPMLRHQSIEGADTVDRPSSSTSVSSGVCAVRTRERSGGIIGEGMCMAVHEGHSGVTPRSVYPAKEHTPPHGSHSLSTASSASSRHSSEDHSAPPSFSRGSAPDDATAALAGLSLRSAEEDDVVGPLGGATRDFRNGSFHFSLMGSSAVKPPAVTQPPSQPLSQPQSQPPFQPPPVLEATVNRVVTHGKPPMPQPPVFNGLRVSSGGASTSSSSPPRNDMILLSAPTEKEPEFVVFSDSTRESIFVRPSDGSDMIPLDLLGRC